MIASIKRSFLASTIFLQSFVYSIPAYSKFPSNFRFPTNITIIPIILQFLQSTNNLFFFAEEIITKRKTEVITTKNIETRVKRHVKFEDGKVFEDSGPIVSTASKKI